jgi:predicted O-linked N-acetylglucosamine transferase (SPINDLY family)
MAEKLYRNILDFQPDLPDALHLLGVAASQGGRHQEAENLIARAIAKNPKSPDYRNNLGLALRALGRFGEAAEAFRAAIALKPGYSEAMNNLALTFRESGNLMEAVEAFRQASDSHPGNFQARVNYGMALHESGQFAEAESAFAGLIAAKPDLPDAHNGLGLALLGLGRPVEAEAAFRKVLALLPSALAAMNNLSLALKAQNRTEEAEKILRESLVIAPDTPELLINLGALLKERDRIGDAIEAFTKALPLSPNNAELIFDLAECNWISGRFDLSQDYWRLAHGLKSRCFAASALRLASAMPIIPESVAQIEARRANMSSELDRLAAEGLHFDDPLAEKLGTNFYLAYHGKSDLELQKKTASLLLKSCSSLGFVASHCAKPRQNGKIRVGLCSAHFNDHTMGHLWRGNVENLPRENIELVLIHALAKQDAIREAFDKAADGVIQLPSGLAEARSAVASLELDVLHYPDLGMDRLTWFMAHSRLAPAQSTWCGHPDTTGLPHMDYFITPMDMEPQGGAAHYSERHVGFASLFTNLIRPPFPEGELSRADFGLPEKGSLYACPQALFKFHPDFDPYLAEILKRDEGSHLVIISGIHSLWSKLLKARIAQHLPDGERRLIFLDPMPRAKFRALLRMVDAVLDTPYFSGGFSNFEALAMHVPVITWPQAFMRCRVTLAAYRRIGVTECIAESPEDFVDLAIRCANDRDWRSGLNKRISESVPVLFEDQEPPKEFARFFFEAGMAARRGEELSGWRTAL